MLEKGKISPRQAGELLFMTIFATVILFVPSIMAEKAGHDAWLAAFAGTLVSAGWHAEIATMAVLLPYLTRPQRAFTSGAGAVLASGLILTLGVVAAISVFGPDLVAVFKFALHYFVHTINIADFLTRFEAVVMAAWVAGVFIKTSMIYYCAALGLGQVLGLAEYRPLVLPLGVIMATLSVTLFANVSALASFLSNVWPTYSITLFTLGLPLLLLAGSLLRGRAESNKHKENLNE